MKKVKISDEAAAAKRAYMKAWRAKNKDKTRGYQANYWEKKAAQIAEATAEATEK